MGHDQCSLVGKIVVNVGDDLNSNISLSRTRWTHDEGQTRLHPGSDGFDLGRGEPHSVPEIDQKQFSTISFPEILQKIGEQKEAK